MDASTAAGAACAASSDRLMPRGLPLRTSQTSSALSIEVMAEAEAALERLIVPRIWNGVSNI